MDTQVENASEVAFTIHSEKGAPELLRSDLDTGRAVEFLRELLNCDFAEDSPSVCPSPRSASGHLKTLKKPHYEACREAKLKPYPPYTWRDTFGTRCAESGVDRCTLARWMGHSSPSVTARYYVHVSERHELARFEKFVEYTEKLRAEAFKPASEALQ